MISTIHIVIAMKPLDGNFCQNALKHGVAGLNIDGCRIGTETRTNASKPRANRNGFIDGFVGGTESHPHDYGRFPANVLHDGSEGVVNRFPMTNKQALCKTDNKSGWQDGYVGGIIEKPVERKLYLDEQNGGSASRFFKECKEFGDKDGRNMGDRC